LERDEREFRRIFEILAENIERYLKF